MTINKYIIAGVLAAATAASAYAFTPTRSAINLSQLRTAAPLPVLTARTVTAPAPEGADVVFSMRPTREEYDACTVIDGNGDGKTFEFQTANASFDWPIVYNNNGAKIDADEWIITPAVTLTDTEHFYQVQIDAMSRSSYNTERFEVKLGKAPTPEAMTITALSETVECLEWETFTGSFGISDPGTYYIGVHACSPAYPTGFRIMLCDLVLTSTVASSMTPGAAQNVSVIPDPQGLLTAAVNFTLPTLAINGKVLPADEPVTVTVETPAATASVSGKPGQTLKVNVAVVNGNNTISLTSWTASGEQGGNVKVQAYCGVDAPSNPVVSSSISSDNMSVTATWEPVTVGVNGGVVNPSTTTYNVYKYVVTSDADGENQTAMWQPLTSGLKECKYTYKLPAGSVQDTYEFMISAKNEIDESEGSKESYFSALLGTPYTLPMSEDFSAYNIQYSGYYVENSSETVNDNGDSNSRWGWATASSIDGDAGSVGALIGYSAIYEPTVGIITLPRFNTAGASNLEMSVTAYLSSLTAQSEIHIATVDGSLDELVGTISSEAGSGWTTLSFTVPDKFNNKGAAYAYIRSSFPSAAEYIMVSGYSIHKKEANDLGIAQFEVSPVTVGSEGTITATVHNYGFNSAKVSSIVAVITDMYAKEVAKVTLNGTVSTLASGEDAIYTGSFTLNKMEYAGSTMTVTVTLAPNDDNATNNVAIATFMPSSVKAPVVTDLRGELNEAGNGISLIWSNPVEGRRTEGFEAVAHGDYSSLISGWTNIDFDRKEEWGLEEVQIPNGGVAKGFQVLSASALNQALGGEGFAAHSGDRFLISFSVAEGQSDDWFISPEIKGEDGFSFWAGIFDPSYPETFEVLYSTSDADLDSFEVLESVTKRTNTWEPFSYDLPEGTRYVAIHYCSNDQFALLLDDFTYTATDSEFTVEGYVVYRNGVSVATVTDTTYEDVIADAAHQTYNVAVIATDADGNKKEYPLGNSYCYATAGLSDIAVAESADGEWFTLQGVRIAAPQVPGVYIYRTAAATVKVVK